MVVIITDSKGQVVNVLVDSEDTVLIQSAGDPNKVTQASVFLRPHEELAKIHRQWIENRTKEQEAEANQRPCPKCRCKLDRRLGGILPCQDCGMQLRTQEYKQLSAPWVEPPIDWMWVRHGEWPEFVRIYGVGGGCAIQTTTHDVVTGWSAHGDRWAILQNTSACSSFLKEKGYVAHPEGGGMIWKKGSK